MTSPSSVAEGLSDDGSLKKAGWRVTKSATAPRAPSDWRGKDVHLKMCCVAY